MDVLDRTRRARDEAAGLSRRARRGIAGEPRGGGLSGAVLLAALSGAAGALAAFLLDPARGRARRTRIMDQGAATLRRATRGAARAIRMATATASGGLAAASHARQPGATDLDDATLAAKVETELFRDPAVPKGSININVERGIVVLRGEVPSAELRDRLAAEAARIGGVWSVRNRLHLPGEPASEELAGAASG